LTSRIRGDKRSASRYRLIASSGCVSSQRRESSKSSSLVARISVRQAAKMLPRTLDQLSASARDVAREHEDLRRLESATKLAFRHLALGGVDAGVAPDG
jgi:hypothetical protein